MNIKQIVFGLVSILLFVSCRNNCKPTEKEDRTDQINGNQVVAESKPIQKLKGQELFNVILNSINSKHIDREILGSNNWKFKPFPDCTDSLIFSVDGTGEIYNCEMGFSSDTRYKISGDTVIVSKYEIPDTDNPRGKTIKTRDNKYFYNGHSLVMIGSTIYHGAAGTSIPDIEIIIEYKKE